MEEVFSKGRNVWLLGGRRRSMQQLLRGGSLHLFYAFPAPAMQQTGKKIKCNMDFLDDSCARALEFHHSLADMVRI